jgi:hypothetical protein
MADGGMSWDERHEIEREADRLASEARDAQSEAHWAAMHEAEQLELARRREFNERNEARYARDEARYERNEARYEREVTALERIADYLERRG